MDLRQLELVVAVSETRSFTRAAERCHVAQSALSHGIAKLETELGQRLFERSSRFVQPTASGEVLTASSRRILAAVEQARAELDALAGLTGGRLAIGATQTAGRVLDTIACFGEFRRLYPEVRLSATSGPMSELIGEVRTGNLDVALGSTTDARGLQVRTLVTDEPLVAIVAHDHPLAETGTIGLKELAGSGPMVEFRAGIETQSSIDTLFRRAGASREIAFELGQISDMVRFAAHGLGAAIVPRAFAGDDVEGAPRFATLQIEPSASLSVSAVHRHEPAPALGAFLDLLGRDLADGPTT